MAVQAHGIRGHKFRTATFNSNEGLKTHGPLTPDKFRTRQVCRACNNGWMSHLEGEFQRRIGYLVEPTWPHLADDMVACLRQEAGVLIRWMIKTAIVFEKSLPKRDRLVIPEGVRPMAKNGVTSSDFCLALGQDRGARRHRKFTKGVPSVERRCVPRKPSHKDGFSFAVYLNYLAMRLIRCPGASAGVKTHVFTLDNTPVVPFWVVPEKLNYGCPVYHGFPTFELFMDSVEIYAGEQPEQLEPILLPHS